MKPCDKRAFTPGRILNGENLAELPVQPATKLELRIDLRTAKALGLDEYALGITIPCRCLVARTK